MKQIAGKVPQGAGNLYLQGGDAGGGLRQNTQQVLSYIINADMDPANIKDYVERNIKPYLTQIDYVREVSVGGAMPLYLDISYDPTALQRYVWSPMSLYRDFKTFWDNVLLSGMSSASTGTGIKNG